MSAVSELLSEKPISYHPVLARSFGSIAAAIFFEHVVHWQGKNKDQWVFRTQEEIEGRTALSPKAQQGARKVLRSLGVIEEKHDGMPRRLYYRPVWEKVEPLLQSCQKDSLDQPNGNSRPDQREGLGEGSKEGSIEESTTEEVLTNVPTSSGEPPGSSATGSSSPARAVDAKCWIVSKLMERVTAARARGANILNPDNDDKRRLGSMTEANWKHHEVQTFLWALDYMVAKAAGEIEGEKAAWCYVGTALTAVGMGWRPGRNLRPVQDHREPNRRSTPRMSEAELKSIADFREIDRKMKAAKGGR